MYKTKTETMTIRMTPEEHLIIKKLAEKNGFSIQHYVLSLSLNSGSSSGLSLSQQKDLISDLRHIGNDLYQLAREDNQFKKVDKNNLSENVKEVERLCQLLK